MGQDFLDIQYCITTLCLSEMLCICCEVLAGNETLDFLALSTWKFNLGNSFQIPAHPPPSSIFGTPSFSENITEGEIEGKTSWVKTV